MLEISLNLNKIIYNKDKIVTSKNPMTELGNKFESRETKSLPTKFRRIK